MIKKLEPSDIVVWKNPYRTNEMGKYRLNFGDLWFRTYTEAQQVRKFILKIVNQKLKVKSKK